MLIFLVNLLGCATLQGEWVGTLVCEDEDEYAEEEVVLTLDPPDDGEYEGTLDIEAEGTIQYEGRGYDVRFELEFDVVVEPDDDLPDRGNELDVEGEVQSCSFRIDGEDVSDDICPDRGDELDLGWELTWEEVDLIVVEGDYCEGELEPE